MADQVLQLAAFVAFPVSGLACIFGNILLNHGMMIRGVRLNRWLATTPPYALVMYARHRKAIASRWLDWVACAQIAGLVLLAPSVWLSRRVFPHEVGVRSPGLVRSAPGLGASGSGLADSELLYSVMFALTVALGPVLLAAVWYLHRELRSKEPSVWAELGSRSMWTATTVEANWRLIRLIASGGLRRIPGNRLRVLAVSSLFIELALLVAFALTMGLGARAAFRNSPQYAPTTMPGPAGARVGDWLGLEPDPRLGVGWGSQQRWRSG